MKAGDFVVHKLSGDTGTVKRVHETIVSVTRDKTYYVDRLGGFTIDTFICQIDNLIVTDKQKQLEIFS